MKNWQGRALLFLIIGAGCVISWLYISAHFKADRQTILLNTTRPDFHKFLGLEKEHSQFHLKGNLSEYFNYFHLVTQAMPENSDGMLMMGYLYEITGNQAKAGAFLKEAHRLDPQFFFANFDLALVTFKQGDYAESVQLLQNALAISPKNTLDRMMHSIIYQQLFSSMDNSRDIIVALRQAYQDAESLLNIALQKGSSGGTVAAPEVFAHFI